MGVVCYADMVHKLPGITIIGAGAALPLQPISIIGDKTVGVEDMNGSPMTPNEEMHSKKNSKFMWTLKVGVQDRSHK